MTGVLKASPRMCRVAQVAAHIATIDHRHIPWARSRSAWAER